jgi:hypothetical protein
VSLEVLQPTFSVAFLAVWALVGGILIRGNKEKLRPATLKIESR